MADKITMSIIAEKCNTSIGTVDRALNNRPGINEKTREQILKAAKELGYKPNRIAGALSRKKVIHIGVVYSFEPVDFYSHIEAGVERAKKELADYGVQVDSIRSTVLSPNEQKELLNSIDPSKYDGFAINSGGKSTTEIINRFMRQGKPVITFNTDASESDRLFYIGNNSRQSGKLGGELMGKMLSGVGKVTILGNFLGTTTFIERFGGFCETIQEQYPGISLYSCAECYSDPHKAFQVVTDVLRLIPDINGIFSTGYAGTIGAAEAVKQLNRTDIKVIGYDLGKQTIEALNDGWCTAVLFQDPFQQGYQAVHLLARHLLDGWLPSQKQLHIETKIVMKYNMENNWKVRIKNPVFWVQVAIAVAAPILAYFGVNWNQLTTWGMLGGLFVDAVKNPVVVAAVLGSMWNAVIDPTTAGLRDSRRALSYRAPWEDLR